VAGTVAEKDVDIVHGDHVSFGWVVIVEFRAGNDALPDELFGVGNGAFGLNTPVEVRK
jgi:hypothetical protein